MKIIDMDSHLWQTAEKNGFNRAEMIDFVRQVANDAMKILPGDFEFTNVQLEPTPGDYVIPETSVMGMTYDPTHVSIWFDASMPYQKAEMLKSLRGTVFHELVHAVNFAQNPWKPDAVFGALSEGLATVFEREYGDVDPLWGKYEDGKTMQKWLDEIKKLPENGIKNREYFIEHGDGRKWIVYKTGAWMIDKLIENGEDLLDLMLQKHERLTEKFSTLSTKS